jgi:hypothetical protein
MGAYLNFASGVSIANQDTDYELIGFGSGAGTNINSGGTNHSKGSYVQLAAGGTAGVTVNDVAGLYLYIFVSSSGGVRFLVDISINGGSSALVTDLYAQPGTNTPGAGVPIYLPLNIPAGSDVQIRTQASTNNTTCNFAIIGVKRSAQSRPCFGNCEHIIAPDTTNTRPSGTNVPLSNAWTQLNASTSRSYGALLGVMGDNGTNPATAQPISGAIGVGASSAEVEIGRWMATQLTTAPNLVRGYSPLFEKAVASGSRISARAYGATAGSDNLRFQVLGFY